MKPQSHLEPARPSEAEPYVLTAQDQVLVTAAVTLLRKLLAAPWPSPAQLVSVAKTLQVLHQLPHPTPGVTATVELTAPPRPSGDRQITHSWQVRVEALEVQIAAHAQVRRKGADPDCFTCLEWQASPGADTVCGDFVADLPQVSDAQPFAAEIAALDLATRGFSLTVSDPDNRWLQPPVAPAAEPAVAPDDESAAWTSPVPTPQEKALEKHSDEAAGRRRGRWHSNPPRTCNLCGGELGERVFFVSGRLRGSPIWATMCAECFLQEGEGIGDGNGRLYRQVAAGEWLLTGGEAP